VKAIMKTKLLGLVGAGVLTMAYACGGKKVDLGSTDGGANSGGSSATGGSSGSGTGGTSATGGSSGASTGGSGGVPDDGVQETSTKLDILFVIDNSLSMADKQVVLSQSAGDFVLRLVNPLCVDGNQNYTAEQPASAADPCPAGATREFKPIRDMHIGLITSSLGGHGADTCSPAGANFNESQNDKAHLLPTVRPQTPVPSYSGQGFLKWDPDGTASPAGQSDPNALAEDLRSHVVNAGEVGCGFESQLEAMYRFLIDPEPPAEIVLENQAAVVQGIDNDVLSQRAAFLRNDSAVLVVILSDENDCSTIDGGIGWLPGQARAGSGTFQLPTSTVACATSANDPCCRSCGLPEVEGPPAGCAPLPADPGCQVPHDQTTDSLNLRCWEQKRRFGVDFLYPIQRYVDGLTQPTIMDRQGESVPNPLFAGGRHHSLVSVAAIVGVPWQDLARDPNDTSKIEYLSAAELQHLDRWKVIAGNPDNHVAPTDPFMVETPEMRSGTNPVTGQAITESTTNPINGHEYLAEPSDLQYACIFPIAEPFDCAAKGSGCDCTTQDSPKNKPLCNGTTQTHSKAYPGIRELDLLQRLGKKSVASSICARNADDQTRQDFGYRPAVRAIIERLNRVLE
jgi:hypothetical protein